MTKTEINQRRRYVQGGMWNDAIIEFSNGTELYVVRCTTDPLLERHQVRAYTRAGLQVIDLTDVAKVHR